MLLVTQKTKLALILPLPIASKTTHLIASRSACEPIC